MDDTYLISQKKIQVLDATPLWLRRHPRFPPAPFFVGTPKKMSNKTGRGCQKKHVVTSKLVVPIELV